MTITEFLLARITEDEAVARDVAAERIRVGEVIGYPAEGEDRSFWADYDGAGPSVSVGADRVLIECEAKRGLVHLLGVDETDPGNALRRRWATELLAGFALAYAGHPDYNPGWRP